MKLIIGGHVVWLTRLPYSEGGHVLQVLFPMKGDLSVHRSLVEGLSARRPSGGVMDVEKFKPHERRDGQSEIRVCEGLELEVVDLARMYGYGVQQMYDDAPAMCHPNKPVHGTTFVETQSAQQPGHS